MTALRLASVSLLWFAVGCAGFSGTPGQPTVQTQYRVQAPDVLLVSIRPAPEITRELQVRPDGYISIDLVGDVPVAGKTVEEIRKDITAKIGKFIVHPDVTVLLQRSNSRRYYILGEVMNPGAYPLIGDTTVAMAFAQAGGGTRLARLNRARLVRAGEQPLVYLVRLSDITQKGEGETNYPLQEGDAIYVPPTVSAQIGYALQVIFFPFQQILGLGGTVIRNSTTGGI